MKKKQDEYRSTRIWEGTHKRLRVISAQAGISLVEMLDRLTREEEARQRKQTEDEQK